MEGNETVPTPQEPDRKVNVDRRLVDSLYERMKASIVSEPVEGEVKVTAKASLSAGGVTLYVADERSAEAARIALQLLALKLAADVAEIAADPMRFIEIISK